MLTALDIAVIASLLYGPHVLLIRIRVCLFSASVIAAVVSCLGPYFPSESPVSFMNKFVCSNLPESLLLATTSWSQQTHSHPA